MTLKLFYISVLIFLSTFQHIETRFKTQYQQTCRIVSGNHFLPSLYPLKSNPNCDRIPRINTVNEIMLSGLSRLTLLRSNILYKRNVRMNKCGEKNLNSITLWNHNHARKQKEHNHMIMCEYLIVLSFYQGLINPKLTPIQMFQWRRVFR